ncbi:hypothetical protein OG730_42440 (plasmid) [Streptomyces sp. NBC_01298]|uniref:hypothetical protein n=1 Tax=Streptomyces sp. NBC_01298 TaxID=2903817 RepID=UPI002E107640|nr:hypothetical protein OG730_42440 [Streptomyces sp. NBC_01298]
MTASPAAALFIPALDAQARITPHTPYTSLTLPADRQYGWRMAQLGGLPEATYYHPDAVLHVHGKGLAQRLPVNPVAWTLASAWRGAQLPYLLVGPALITGTENRHDGSFAALPAPLAAQTQNAIAAATAWWRDNHLHLPLWPFSLDSAAFAPAITATRNAL